MDFWTLGQKMSRERMVSVPASALCSMISRGV